jgi:polysaccharide pyruvyl transferase WcaK-like protein
MRVFIAEQIPSYNKGEEAILDGILKTFEVLGNAKVTLVSSYPKKDYIYYDSKVKLIFAPNTLPETIHIDSRFYLSLLIFALKHFVFMILYKLCNLKATSIMKDDIWKEYLRTDIVIIGHDSVLGFERIILLVPFLKALKKLIVIYAGSIRTFKRNFQKTIARFALNNVDLITLREPVSYNYLKEIGVSSHMFVTADPAFLMRPVLNEKVEIILAKTESGESKRPIIGVCPSRIASTYIESDLASFKDKYQLNVRVLSDIIDCLVEELDAMVILMPHVFGPKDLNDVSMIEDIYNAVENKDAIVMVKDELSAREIKRIIGACDLFIGERLHSIIAASSMHTVYVAVLELSNRTRGILEGVSFQGKGIYDIQKLNFNSLMQEIHYVWKRRVQIKNHLVHRTKIMKRKALSNGELLKSILCK